MERKDQFVGTNCVGLSSMGANYGCSGKQAWPRTDQLGLPHQTVCVCVCVFGPSLSLPLSGWMKTRHTDKEWLNQDLSLSLFQIFEN